MTNETEKTDYKSTLCMPGTGFPMRANLPQREPEMLKRWSETGLREKLNSRPAPGGDYVLHDGPPYANGHIHIGHALNKILKDIVVRHQSMNGKRAVYVPGWDCHGLPIEQKVASDLGPKRAQMTPLQVRQKCEEYARKWVKVQSTEFQRLGIGGEWDNPYLTLDPKVEVGILSTLRDLVAQDYIYKGLKPVFWCASCQTALADAEVEYADHVSASIYVKFPLLEAEKNEATAGLLHPSVIIWTTTPWTLPANLAVSLHPDYKYVALRVKAEHGGSPREEDYIVARDMVEAFTKNVGISSFEIVRELASKDLEHMRMAHPVQPDRTSQMVLGSHVTLEQGTGAVHTAPGHGMEDFIVCREYDIPTVVPVDGAGRFTNEFSLMEGMGVWEANKPIIRYLDEKDILVHSSDFTHSYPHCWRCHKPIIYRATEQWFMNVDHKGLREAALERINNAIRFIPSWGHDRIYNMMQSRPDWCLSRQRVWGVPIPAVVCRDSGKAILSTAIIDKFIEIVSEQGTNAWYDLPVEAFIPEDFVSPYSGGRNFEKEFNILDVWFDSGSTHIAVLEQRPELSWPADLYLEGSDQHRGWFQSSLITAMGARQAPPYRAVLTHGFVLDGKGEAMSKSKGNVTAPEEIVKKYGADVLRLWVASEDYRADLKMSNEIMDRVAEGYRRIRNTLRYLLGNLSDFDAKTNSVSYEKLPEADRWILNELYELSTNIQRAYNEYEFHKIYHWLQQFCVVQLSSIYLDMLKDRVYCSGPDSPERRAAQTAQHAVAHTILRLAAPVLVFTADEAYHYLDSEADSIHLAAFTKPPEAWKQPVLAAEWKGLLDVRTDVLRALEEARQVRKAIGQSLEARVVVAVKEPRLRALLDPRQAQLADLFITSQAEVADEPPSEEGICSLQGNQVHVTVLKAEGEKCQRCWKYSPSVGKDEAHKGLCNRCADVLRRYY